MSNESKLDLAPDHIARRRHHRRLPKFESFDEVRLRVVPRFKTSGLSGDEWRTSVLVEFSFKGEVVHSFGARDMASAILLLGQKWIEAQEPIPNRVIEVERERCDQPGCPDFATVQMEVVRLAADDGSWLDAKERHGTPYRQFCDRHANRGDCSREDRDENYVNRQRQTTPVGVRGYAPRRSAVVHAVEIRADDMETAGLLGGGDVEPLRSGPDGVHLRVRTAGGPVEAKPGDYLVRDAACGDLRVMSTKKFRQVYAPCGGEED